MNWVEAHLARQKRLTEDETLQLRAVVSEAALRLEVGGVDVLIEQLDHLLNLSGKPNVHVYVLPRAAGAHPALASNFSLLHFEHPSTDKPLAYFDSPLGGYMVDDPGDVATMAIVFNDLMQVSLSETELAAFIKAACKELK